ncbi:MAG: hypothetical protein QOH71_3808 [Blastocatellia bacterium]|nr:hypothetical protein [Blastocatellia bacterium]
MKANRSEQNNSGELSSFPPRVSLAQWILAAIPFLISVAVYEATSYKVLALVTQFLSVVSLVLLVVVAKEALRARVIGKCCLIAGTVIFYWGEALVLSLGRNPFSIPEGFPINATQFDQGLISQALIYVSMFQFLLLVGYSIRPRMMRPVRFFTSRIDSLSFDRWMLATLLVMAAVVPLLVFYDFDTDKLVEALLASRSSVDFDAPEPGIAQHLALFGIYGAALFFVYALKASTWRRFWWLFLGVVVALPFVMGGTRHIWLYISLPSVLIVLRGFSGHLNRYRIMGLTATVLVVFAVAQLQFVYRSVGWREMGNDPSQELSQLNNNGQLTALMFAEHLVPDQHPYFKELVEPYFLIHWIPRQMWPEKPIIESWAFYNESYVQGASFNVTPSVIGQFHLNWGLPGVIFIGTWLGFLTFVADRVLLSLNPNRQRAMFVAVGMFYAFIISSFRFYAPVYFSYFLFGLLAMFLLTNRRRLSFVRDRLVPRLTTGENLTWQFYDHQRFK